MAIGEKLGLSGPFWEENSVRKMRCDRKIPVDFRFDEKAQDAPPEECSAECMRAVRSQNQRGAALDTEERYVSKAFLPFCNRVKGARVVVAFLAVLCGNPAVLSIAISEAPGLVIVERASGR
jgi:hypothetical protein